MDSPITQPLIDTHPKVQANARNAYCGRRSNATPVVLSLSGHDPSGGAGIQADIETLGRLQCRPCTVITALTVQDTQDVKKVIPQRPDDVYAAAVAILSESPVAVIKIGLVGSAEVAIALHRLLDEFPAIPVVLDPVLRAGGGADLADTPLIHSMQSLLLPRTTILTPNSQEARMLASATDLDACGQRLLTAGCQYVLITGAHEEGPRVINRLYDHNGVESHSWERLPHSYHGSGCTLASAIAGGLARGWNVSSAVHEAQAFTWRALKAGYCPGRGQYLPDRWFAWNE
jgi:hydroxymethylpyrimidine/phosphomethylpyrimidine kinase